MPRPPAGPPPGGPQPGGPPPRPTFEPYYRPAPPAPPSQPPPPAMPPPTPRRPDRDPLRAMAPVFTTLAAIGLTALAIWLPVREAQDEEIKHYPSTAYIDVPRGAAYTWHDVRWRLLYQKPVPWKYYSGASPPPGNFVRVHIGIHAVLLGKKAKLGGFKADSYLHDDLTGQTFDWKVRDNEEREWDVAFATTQPGALLSYNAAKGLDLDAYVDVPPSEVGSLSLVAKFEDHKDDFNFSKTPSPRVTLLRFRR